MMKNSPSRISKRRQGALVRRQANLVQLNKNDVTLTRKGDGEGDLAKRINTKRVICETDIANLQKKGVRA